jgi:hypothetical protein
MHRIYSSGEIIITESSPHHYLVRLVAYLLILWAIIEKNLPSDKGKR